MLPIVIRSTEEMLRLVPDHLREASWRSVSSKARTILTVVLPPALPGIVSGVLLAMARAAGETAPLLFTIGAATSINWNPFNGPNTALSVQIFAQRPAALRRRPGAGVGCGADADRDGLHPARPVPRRGRVLRPTRDAMTATNEPMMSEDHRWCAAPRHSTEAAHGRRCPPARRGRRRARPRASRRSCSSVDDLAVYYGSFRAVREVTLSIRKNEITAFIGPSGCGKTTVLRCLNRMNDLIPSARVEGKVPYHGIDLYGPNVSAAEVRRRIGMVFQRPNPFPKSIYDNVAFGPQGQRGARRAELDEIVEASLRGAALWDEVKDRLEDARRSACRAVSSSGCASPGRSPWSRR